MPVVDEDQCREWARDYAQRYGTALLQEQELMRQQGVSYATPRADAQAQALLGYPPQQHAPQPAPPGWLGQHTPSVHPARPKRSRILRPTLMAAAACLLLAVGLFVALPSIRAILPALPFDAGSQSGISQPDAVKPGGQQQARELDFKLPQQFAVAATDWDNGQSVYHLTVNRRGDVVMCIQEADDDYNKSRPLPDSIIIDGTAVPAVILDEFKLLRFEHGGLIYTLSCEDDPGILAALYRSIVDPANKRS
jgi:hypothetical protein